MIISTLSLIADFKLELRDTQMTNAILLISLFCTGLVGISQWGTEDLFRNVSRNFLKIEQREKEFGDTGRISSGSSTLLFFNFFIAFTLCSYLFFASRFTVNTSLFFALIASVIFMFLQQVGFRIAAWMSGETNTIQPIVQLTRQTWQLGGILFLVLAVVWVLNKSNTPIFIITYFVFIGILLLFRFLKGVSFSLNHRISWYYFILYLCTLEILPLAVLMKLVVDYSGVKF